MKSSTVVNFLLLLKCIPVSKTIDGKPKIAVFHPVKIIQLLAFCGCYAVYAYTTYQVRFLFL